MFIVRGIALVIKHLTKDPGIVSLIPPHTN